MSDITQEFRDKMKRGQSIFRGQAVRDLVAHAEAVEADRDIWHRSDNLTQDQLNQRGIEHEKAKKEIARLQESVLRLERERDIARHGLQEAFDTYHDWTSPCQCAKQMADNIETTLRLSETKP
jgi:predicted  nucleic acid-binding Zn-ribbon protein